MALQHLWGAMLSRSLRERNADRQVATVGDSASAVGDQLYYLDRLAQAQRWEHVGARPQGLHRIQAEETI